MSRRPNVVDRGPHGAGPLGFLGHVEGQRQGAVPELGRHLVGVGHVGHGHSGTVLGEQTGLRGALPPGRPGDEGHLPLEAPGH